MRRRTHELVVIGATGAGLAIVAVLFLRTVGAVVRHGVMHELAIVAVFSLLTLLAVFIAKMYLRETPPPGLQEELGFRMGTAYIDDGSRWFQEAMGIESVEPGGVFDRAGFVRGDIVVEPRTLGQLYRRLDKSRGQEVTIVVVPGGDGLPLRERPKKTIRFIVPHPGPV